MHACSEKSLQTSAKNIFEKMGNSIGLEEHVH